MRYFSIFIAGTLFQLSITDFLMSGSSIAKNPEGLINNAFFNLFVAIIIIGLVINDVNKKRNVLDLYLNSTIYPISHHDKEAIDCFGYPQDILAYDKKWSADGWVICSWDIDHWQADGWDEPSYHLEPTHYIPLEVFRFDRIGENK